MIVRSPLFAGALRQNGLGNVCLSCSLRTELRAFRSPRRNISSTNKKATAVQRLGTGYFFANRDIFGNAGRGGMSTVADGLSGKDVGGAKKIIEKESTISTTTRIEDLPPHRRRRHKQSLEQEGDKEFLPENSSTVHADRATALPQSSTKRLLSILLSLSKPRLSMLVVLTACSAYTLYPVPSLLSSTLLETPSLSPLTLLFLTTGTALCAASANTLNMLYEPKFDAQMSRTRNRPLVRKLISPGGALLFAIASGVVGVGGLYYGVNPTTAFLGALNIGLYAGVYTPLKRITVFNTWVGAIVGGIPPLMGWTAAAGQTSSHLSSSSTPEWQDLLLGPDSAGGWLLAGLLFAWQLSHFMSLSWSIRHEYQGAGYRMLSWVNPAMNGRVALRYSILCIPLCIGLCYANVTEWTFAAASMPVNIWLVREAYKFWKYEGQKGSAKKLFWASVWHLPVVLVLAMVEKKGLWSRILSAVFGQRVLDGEDEEWEYVDEDEDIPVQKAPVPILVAANANR
ncbi:Protoheme IX farnesyltransferase, mitochondrial [Ciborinia camelliae]|nr:Protoheme IX farnesyltransferase, mitochondrial [Ciborinia camelliae]